MQKRHNTISFNLTTSADQCDLFKSFLNIISEVVLIFCFLNQLFFLGGGGWEEEVDYNIDRSSFSRHTAQVMLLICITVRVRVWLKFIII